MINLLEDFERWGVQSRLKTSWVKVVAADQILTKSLNLCFSIPSCPLFAPEINSSTKKLKLIVFVLFPYQIS